jgi:hypothetical protein
MNGHKLRISTTTAMDDSVITSITKEAAQATLHCDNCRHRSFATRGARAAGCSLDRAGGLDRHFRVCAKFSRVSPAAGWAALEWLGSGSWQ